VPHAEAKGTEPFASSEAKGTEPFASELPSKSISDEANYEGVDVIA
jgi:hypothetical protein